MNTAPDFKLVVVIFLLSLFGDLWPFFSNFTAWNSNFFTTSLIIEGATEKVLQFKMQLKFFYDQNLGFYEQSKVVIFNAK